MEEDELVLCTVEKVTNTVTFVRLPDGREGTIISSEIAPGRIKFMRQYVVPNKVIVCKVLKDDGQNVHLSLRRVNSKEKKEVMLRYKQEKAINVALGQLFGEKKESIIKKILEDYEDLVAFVDSAREDESVISKYVGKKDVEAIRKIIDRKKKHQELKKHITITCLEDNGVENIKKIFADNKQEINVTYVAAGEFQIKLTVEDFKQGKKDMQNIIEGLQTKAKKLNCEFNIKE